MLDMNYTPVPLKPTFHVDAIVNIAYYHLTPTYVFPGEAHDFWEFIYVDRGSIVVTAGTEKYLLKAGELAFHKPNEFHAFEALGAGSVVVASFLCKSPTMGHLVGKVLPIHRQERQCLQSLIAEASLAYEYFENDPPHINLQKRDCAPWGSDHLIKTYMEQLFVYISRRGEEIQVSQRILSSNQQHQHLALTQQLKDYLSMHYGEKQNLNTLATAMGVSVTQLKRVFRQQTGQTVMAYLTALRISEAKHRIRQGEYNFSQIAQQVGFDSIYYFSSLFKKQTGMTLTEYSRSLKG